MTYDLIVLGGGPAGYIACERAGHAGLQVLLIEKRFIGGVCLNEGCIPTKTLLYSAKMLDSAQNGEKYGVLCKEAVLDHKKVLARKNRVVKTLVTGVKSRLKTYKVTTVEGGGAITGRSADGYEVKAGTETYHGKRLLIATGAAPIIPPIPGIQEGLASGRVVTNRELLELEEIPEHLVVVGGGIVGLEMASYFNSAGSRVTVIEMFDHIAGGVDKEIADILVKNYQKKGIDFQLNATVTGVKGDSIDYEKAGEKKSVACDTILMSVGRKPAGAGSGAEKVGVAIENGAIKTDGHGLTGAPDVYAAGDVNGVSMLAHTAYREAEVCVNHMLGRKDVMRYRAIPSVIYTNPEVACVGENEASAREKGIDAASVKISMRYSGRYVAENEGGDGICKMLIDKKYRRLIGVHMIGNYASEVIYGAGAMIEMEMRVEDVKELVFPHPTVSEIIRAGIFEF